MSIRWRGCVVGGNERLYREGRTFYGGISWQREDSMSAASCSTGRSRFAGSVILGSILIDMDRGIRFYRDLLGFRVSDIIDHSSRAQGFGVAGLSNANSYFTRYGTDHHAMVLFNQRAREALGRPGQPGITINQITWQVGSLSEVGNGIHWFNKQGIKQQRSGRDMPGSNWHTYLLDPDGHSNELYYGIEQIGWNGHSKPRTMYNIGFEEPPPLPQISEFRRNSKTR